MNENNYYRSRINKAVDYLNKNLSEELNIKKIADEAHFSVFHFQRIYKALQNETPHQTLLRLRLEKSVFLIKHHPEKSLLEIALESGFSSAENFSRQFKNRFNLSPSRLRKDKELQNSRIYQENNTVDFYTSYEDSRKLQSEKFDIKIEELPAMKIAFVRSVFGEDGSPLIKAYQDLISWATEKNIDYKGELKRFGMSIDDPEVTPANKYRYDFAIKVPENVVQDDSIIEFSEIPAGQYVTIHVVGAIQNVAQAWDQLYKNWLPASSFLPKHYPAIEEFIQGPEEIGWESFNIKCRVPIEERK